MIISTVAVILLAIVSSPAISKEVLPPVPALRSHWLVLHVTFSFIGEAFFALAFSASIYYLTLKEERKKAGQGISFQDSTVTGNSAYHTFCPSF